MPRVILFAAVGLALGAAGCRRQAQEQPYVPDEQLRKILAIPQEERDGPDRWTWCEALGGRKAAAEKLTEHLRRGKPSVRERERIGDVLEVCDREAAVPGLALLAKDLEMDPDFRWGMVELLADEHGCPQSVAPIVEVLKSDPSPFVRGGAAGQLFYIYFDRHAEDFQTISQALIDAMADKDEDVRDKVAWSLGLLAKREPNLRERIEKLVTDKDANVRSTATETLRLLKSGALPELPK
jgi:hypothetical protein